jgi:hypothetical protein
LGIKDLDFVSRAFPQYAVLMRFVHPLLPRISKPSRESLAMEFDDSGMPPSLVSRCSLEFLPVPDPRAVVIPHQGFTVRRRYWRIIGSKKGDSIFVHPSRSALTRCLQVKLPMFLISSRVKEDN